MSAIVSPAYRARHHPAYWAFLVHRLSGLALTLFLPLHFLVLGQALRGEAALDGLLRWTDNLPLKAAEILLVTAAAAHLAGGLRLLLLEGFAWRGPRKDLAALAAGVSLAAALLFALAVVR